MTLMDAPMYEALPADLGYAVGYRGSLKPKESRTGALIESS